MAEDHWDAYLTDAPPELGWADLALNVPTLDAKRTRTARLGIALQL